MVSYRVTGGGHGKGISSHSRTALFLRPCDDNLHYFTKLPNPSPDRYVKNAKT